jgi:hypothetical protein
MMLQMHQKGNCSPSPGQHYMDRQFKMYEWESLIWLFHIMPQPPPFSPPLLVVVIAAVLQISSKTSWTNSPVVAEHSMYLSHLISCATLRASCG